MRVLNTNPRIKNSNLQCNLLRQNLFEASCIQPKPVITDIYWKRKISCQLFEETATMRLDFDEVKLVFQIPAASERSTKDSSL